MKLWSGRFGKETDALVNDFNASIQFDQRLYKEDITGSMAHAKMLGACGIISAEDTEAIVNGLQSILEDVEAGKETGHTRHILIAPCRKSAVHLRPWTFHVGVRNHVRQLRRERDDLIVLFGCRYRHGTETH